MRVFQRRAIFCTLWSVASGLGIFELKVKPGIEGNITSKETFVVEPLERVTVVDSSRGRTTGIYSKKEPKEF